MFSQTLRGHSLYDTALKDLCELRIIDHGAPAIAVDDLLLILRLPKLQLLALDKTPCEFEVDAGERGGGSFPIQILAFSRAKYQPEGLEWLLTRCPNLTTFIWEDYTMTRIPYPCTTAQNTRQHSQEARNLRQQFA